MGAWIETPYPLRNYMNGMSHPTWVRGLKHSIGASRARKLASHPTWVRGLKLGGIASAQGNYTSHPTWVRGLKP